MINRTIGTDHLHDKVLVPLGVERLLLGLRLVHPLAIEVEHDERIGLSAAVGTVDLPAFDERDAQDTLV